MQDFFKEAWLSLQPKQYYRFLIDGRLKNKWSFFFLAVLFYAIILMVIITWQLRLSSRDFFSQATEVIKTWPTSTELVWQGGQLKINNLPQPFERVVTLKEQKMVIRLEAKDGQTIPFNDFGAQVTTRGLFFQDQQGQKFFSWSNLPDQKITQPQLLNFVSQGWHQALFLVVVIGFIFLVLGLTLFWWLYIWLWSWLLHWPAKRNGLFFSTSEITFIVIHLVVVAMITRIILYLVGLPSLLFLPTLIMLLFWSVVIKDWPKIDKSILSENIN